MQSGPFGTQTAKSLRHRENVRQKVTYPADSLCARELRREIPQLFVSSSQLKHNQRCGTFKELLRMTPRNKVITRCVTSNNFANKNDMTKVKKSE